MSLEIFIKKLEAEFDELPAGSIEPDKEFREVIEWNSMNALMIIAFLKVEYRQDISVEDLQQCSTFREIYSRFVLQVS
jgi:acyl carrier protein